MNDDLREKLLIHRVHRYRDQEAFATLVAGNQSRLRLFLRRLCHDHDLADDLAQDAFLIAYQKLVSFQGTGNFQGWLIRIAHRCFLIHARREKRKQVVLADYHQSLSAEADNCDSITAAQLDLERAMAGLNHGEAAAITLCYSFGYSHQEIADILETPLGTVKSQIRRGMEKLRLTFSARQEFDTMNSNREAI